MLIKELVKNSLDNWQNCKPNMIWDRIESYDYVSFDIFDTLVKRDVGKPHDVFKIVGERICWDEFPRVRISAEISARRKSKWQEVTLAEIYNCIELPSDLSADDVMRQEEDCENQVCHANHLLLPTYLKCLLSEKVVVLTSDMYLSQKVIEEILEKSQIIGYKRLYLSSSERLVKTKGLFYKVVSDLGVNPGEIVHVGNSYHNDYLAARRVGLAAIKVKTQTENRV